MAPVTILLAVEEGLFRAGLRTLIEREPDFRVVGEAGDAEAAIQQASELSPNVIILDLELSGAMEPNVLRSLCGRDLGWRALLLARQADTGAVAEAFRAGAYGVTHKGLPLTTLIQGIRAVLKGDHWMGVERPIKAPPARKPGGHGGETYQLTKREVEIVSAIVSGLSNQEIAKRLAISEDTVKHHLTHIFDKVGAYNRLELALFAIHHGLVGR